MRAARLRIAAAAAITAALAAGCLSTGPNQYFIVDMTPSGEAAAPYRIEVDRLVPVDQLIPNEILYMPSDTEVAYYSDALWAASLGDIVAEKLEAELEADAGAPVLLLSGELQRFNRVDTPEGTKVHVRIEARLRPEGTSRYDEPLTQGVYEAMEPAASESPQEIVRALSRALERAAADIARDAAAAAWPSAEVSEATESAG